MIFNKIIFKTTQNWYNLTTNKKQNKMIIKMYKKINKQNFQIKQIINKKYNNKIKMK